MIPDYHNLEVGELLRYTANGEVWRVHRHTPKSVVLTRGEQEQRDPVEWMFRTATVYRDFHIA